MVQDEAVGFALYFHTFSTFRGQPGIYLEGKFGVRSEIDVYVGDKDIEVTGQPIQTEIVSILKTP